MADAESMPPAVRRLLDKAYKSIAIANELQRRGRQLDALEAALVANEYVRAARALTDMTEARHG